MPVERYGLGLPMWGLEAWRGELFPADAKKRDFLGYYAQVFNAVEANTTFYGLPSEATVDRWCAQTPLTFRFCCKFPRAVSHEGGLMAAGESTARFLRMLERLANRVGPAFLQLPPRFDPSELGALDRYLGQLPREFHYGVEVRHPGFFDRSRGEESLRRVLERHGAEWVIMDTRMLMGARKTDAHTREMQRRKPRLPVRKVALGKHPFVRIVNGDDLESSQPCLRAWAKVAAEWIAEGREPYMFIHSADDFFSPGMARAFHRAVGEHVPVGELPNLPLELGSGAAGARGQRALVFPG